MTGFASKRARSRSLQDDILDRMGEDIAREIDKELLDIIMIDVLTKDEGWTQTKVNPAFSDRPMTSGSFNDWYAETAEWIRLNATGDYKLLKGQWLFKDSRDATMFILKWS
jgi:hypothetical protein